MDEYAALAQRVVLTLDDVRGCLVLSRDGLVLGAFPEDEEAAVKPAWLRFVHVGDARRSFVEFGDQIWAFVHRGPYAAFVIASTSVRPGVLLDQLEQAVLVAEETRARRDTLKVPETKAAPSGRPRTTLHPSIERASPEEVPVQAVPHPDPVGDPTPPASTAIPTTSFRRPVVGAGGSPTDEAAGEGTSAEAPAPTPSDDAATDPRPPDGPPQQDHAEEPGEIDRVLLAKEFSGLLQLGADDDEGRS